MIAANPRPITILALHRDPYVDRKNHTILAPSSL